jgi:hypothetical protein
MNPPSLESSLIALHTETNMIRLDIILMTLIIPLGKRPFLIMLHISAP